MVPWRKRKGNRINKDKSKLILFLRSLEGTQGHIGNKERQIKTDTQHTQRHEIRLSAYLGSMYHTKVLKFWHFSDLQFLEVPEGISV